MSLSSKRKKSSSISRSVKPESFVEELKQEIERKTTEEDIEDYILNRRNTDILDTSFTIGMEFEPTVYDGTYYTEDPFIYDRQIINRSRTNLSMVTAESVDITKFIDGDFDQDKTCKYNIEFNIGVLGLLETIKISDFMENPQIFNEQIKDELIEFQRFYDSNKDSHIRNLKIKTDSDFEKFEDIKYGECSLSTELTPEEVKQSIFYYINAMDDSSNIIVRPQVTLGLSYAFYTPLFDFYLDKGHYFAILSDSLNKYIVYDIYDEINKIDTNLLLVFQGFMLLLMSYSSLSATYYSKNIVENMKTVDSSIPDGVKGLSYFKESFVIKPRSNLAESYKYLIAEYHNFSHFFDLVYENAIEKYSEFLAKYNIHNFPFNPSIQNEYKKIISFNITLLKEITRLNPVYINIYRRLLNNPLNYSDDDDIYEDIIAYILLNDKSNNDDLIIILSTVNLIYIMNRIKNPKKVVKLRFLDKSKIGNNCKILDGYFFSYEGQNKTKIIKLEKLGLIEVMDNKVYDFAHTSDPILLTYSNEKICTKGPRREEVFELIPNNSNLIIELRSPENIVDFEDDWIYMKDINPFLDDIFFRLNKIFKKFLEWNEIIPSSSSPSQSRSRSPSPSQS